MHHIVWLIGALVSLWGVAAVLKPGWMKQMMQFFSVRLRFQAAAAVKVAIGVIFLVFARECRIWQVIVAVGLLATAGNLWALTMKAETARKFMDWWQNRPLWVYRLWGVAAVVFGGVVIYAGWPV